jgi:hypothetical protein
LTWTPCSADEIAGMSTVRVGGGLFRYCQSRTSVVEVLGVVAQAVRQRRTRALMSFMADSFGSGPVSRELSDDTTIDMITVLWKAKIAYFSLSQRVD